MMKKRRNIRQRERSDDSDEEKVETVPTKSDEIPFLETLDYHTQIKQIEKDREKSKKKDKHEKKQGASLLTFNYEEDEGGEVFKIKKSSHSRKQARKVRERQKQLRSQEEVTTEKSAVKNGDNKRSSAPPPWAAPASEALGVTKDRMAEAMERRDRAKEEAKKVKEEEEEEEEEREVVLNGMDAEAAALAQEDLEELSRDTDFNTFIPTGGIPGANLIHAARKRRQQAREKGDFIPVDDTQRFQNERSRLVRDDDNDQSGSDSDGGRMGMSVKQQTNKQRVQQALSAEGVSPEGEREGQEDHNDELERWEQQQIKKGTASVAQQAQTSGPGAEAVSYYPGQQQFSYYPSESSTFPAVDQSLVYGAAYPTPSTATGPDSPQPQAQRQVPDALALAAKLPTITVESIVKRLRDRLASLSEIHSAHLREEETVQEQLQDAALSSTSLRDTQGDVSQSYTFYQETRGYVRDLVECLDEKLPLINGLERAMLTLLQGRARQLLDRRQQDIQDQSKEFTKLSHKAAGAPNLTRVEKKAAREDEESRQRRGAEREARRSRRRRARQIAKQSQAHNDGTSSDDEMTDSLLAKYKAEKDRIQEERDTVFEDVEEDFCSLPAILQRFKRWKFSQGDSYSDAYIGLCLPKLCGPFIRVEMLDWNPLEANCKELESFRWYDSLMFYGFRNEHDIDREDDDIKLIPRIIEKIVLPKLSDLVETVWDPMSTLQTHRLIDTIHLLAEDYPTVSADNKNTQVLLRAVVMRIRKTLDNDVYMPLFPADILENKASGANAFLQRQFWCCVKLLGNLLSWHGLVVKEQLMELAVDGLLNRYLMLSLNNSEVDETSINKCQRIVSSLPVAWFEDLEGDCTVRKLEPLCAYLKHAAATLHTGQAGRASPINETDLKKNRMLTKQIIKLLVSLRAMNHALQLTDDYSLKDMKQMVAS